eukprot:scaffold26360_cov60-Phaeocystis_antarctica.AAC.6
MDVRLSGKETDAKEVAWAKAPWPIDARLFGRATERRDEVGVRIAVVEGPVALLLAERRRQRDVCLSEEGLEESLASDGGEALGKGDRGQGGGVGEGVGADGDEAARQGDGEQGVASVERVVADGGEALGKGDRRQGGGAVEGLGADGNEALGKRDGDHRDAVLERLIADGGDAVGYHDVAVRVGRVQAARRRAAECEQDQDRREHLGRAAAPP